MGGPSQSSQNTQSSLVQEQNQIAQNQLSVEQQALNTSNQEQAQYQALTQPAVNFNTALASGDPTAIMTALAPQTAAFSQAKSQNAGQIYEQLPPGAARDYALAQNTMNSNNQVAQTEAAQVAQAPNTLASIGAGFGSNALQELGASLGFGNSAVSATNAAANANSNLMNVQEQSKSSTLGFLGQLVGAGAGLATGGLFSGMGGGNSSVPTSGPYSGVGIEGWGG